MKFLVVLTSVLTIAFAQRPWYAGSKPIGHAELANRFKTDEDASTTSNAVDNFHRYYEYPPAGIPIDAHGDVHLVNILNTWPRENRPFWLLNAEQIEAHRNTNRYAPGYNQQGLRSRFGGQDASYHREHFNQQQYDYPVDNVYNDYQIL